MLFVSIVLLLCTVLVIWSRMRPKGSPPVMPGALPLVGHAHLMIGSSQHMWNKVTELFQLSNESGGVVTCYIGPHTVYVVTDPDDSFTIANTCFEKPYMYDFAKEFVNNGLVTADVHTWKKHRKLLNPVFNSDTLMSFLDIINRQSTKLVSTLETKVGKGPFDVFWTTMFFTLEIACETTLGLTPKDDSKITKEYSEASESLMEVFVSRFMKFWLHLPFMFNMTSLKKEHDRVTKIMIDISKKIILERKLKLQTTPDDNFDNNNFKSLLDQILELNKKNSLTDDDIREHLDTFILGTIDPTAVGVMFSLIAIGAHQEVQDRIYKELKEVLEDRDVTKYDLQKLVYLEAVIKECLRLFPPTPVIGRKITSDVKLKQYTLRPGATCILSLFGTNRNPIWGADADQFKPDRWLQPGALPANPNAYASFSHGKRNCIGKPYGWMIVKTSLAHILRRYRVFADDFDNLQLKIDIHIKPVTGHHIRLEKR